MKAPLRCTGLKDHEGMCMWDELAADFWRAWGAGALPQSEHRCNAPLGSTDNYPSDET